MISVKVFALVATAVVVATYQAQKEEVISQQQDIASLFEQVKEHWVLAERQYFSGCRTGQWTRSQLQAAGGRSDAVGFQGETIRSEVVMDLMVPRVDVIVPVGTIEEVLRDAMVTEYGAQLIGDDLVFSRAVFKARNRLALRAQRQTRLSYNENC